MDEESSTKIANRCFKHVIFFSSLQEILSMLLFYFVLHNTILLTAKISHYLPVQPNLIAPTYFFLLGWLVMTLDVACS